MTLSCIGISVKVLQAGLCPAKKLHGPAVFGRNNYEELGQINQDLLQIAVNCRICRLCWFHAAIIVHPARGCSFPVRMAEGEVLIF